MTGRDAASPAYPNLDLDPWQRALLDRLMAEPVRRVTLTVPHRQGRAVLYDAARHAADEGDVTTERCESCGKDTPLNAIDHGVCWRCRDLAGVPYDE